MKINVFQKMENFVYKNLVVPLQGSNIYDFVSSLYTKGDTVLDFGSGIGTNSTLFHPKDYTGVDVDKSRVLESKHEFPGHQFQEISYISNEDDRLPFEDKSFDIIFISLCLHHIDSSKCKVLFSEFRRLLKMDGFIIGIEPVVTSNKLSNIFMNLIDGGDHIIGYDDYHKMYLSESYETTTINSVTTFGYHLWQYTARPTDSKSHPYSSDMTNYRKVIKPLNTGILYGKWVGLFYGCYVLTKSLWIKIQHLI
tara:strand:- start:119 stop:874 length:756 start_codon:yes stop_codon:yes gene_type:complete